MAETLYDRVFESLAGAGWLVFDYRQQEETVGGTTNAYYDGFGLEAEEDLVRVYWLPGDATHEAVDERAFERWAAKRGIKLAEADDAALESYRDEYDLGEPGRGKDEVGEEYGILEAKFAAEAASVLSSAGFSYSREGDVLAVREAAGEGSTDA